LVVSIEDKKKKKSISSAILADLPDWFGLPDSTAEYVKCSQELPFWAELENDTAKGFILKYMETIVKDCVEGKLFYDFKTQLQELVQQNGEHHIVYSVIHESGPDHNKAFVTEVRINNIVTGEGKGRSKKESEQNAAKDALNKFDSKGVLKN